ncbi:histone-like nucleoid-structuring protein Lsr2 [Cellulosimicrobium cellulans]|uniref:histone-like nucleoid-structuring protein Lsr2 n=1 Tax=Cellulosimicrobium cellulans TaxID=1710 RepID=UPI0002E17ED5|nr:Lsr2 family protein [Cellulosimicrobium cellulans]
MVQQRHVIITDDLDGSEGARTYAFSWQQGRYEIDLSDEHRDELLTALQPYITAARRVGPRVASTGTTSSTTSDRAAVRAWARENGYEVSDRGRIPGAVIEAYAARG